jgi:hypothetical protein
MIRTPDSVKRYNSAKHRFLRARLINFFVREFPKFFGPVIRERIADELIDLFEKTNPEVKRIKPGQILWNALDKNTRGDSPNRKYVTVVLSVITEEDIEQLIKGTPKSIITQTSIVRMMRETYDQGGILSTRDISLITLRNSSDISKLRLKYEKENDCLIPHTGLLHDMGSTISHKTTIIRKVVVDKKDPADVARECNHSQRAVDRYLKDFFRVKTAYKHNKDKNYIHVVTGIAKHVVGKYIEIINNF